LLALSLLVDLIGRAGGGHSFGGGSSGGGGGGGFSGGGGGPIFFGGGGGGGAGLGAGIFVLIVIAILAVLVLSAIGRHRMHDAFSGGVGGGGQGGVGGSGGGGGGSGGSGVGGVGSGVGGGGQASGTPSSSQWTGSQAPAIESVRGDVFPGTASSAGAGAAPVQEGLAQIQSHDPAFDQDAFLEQVQKAFFVVQEAWSERKPDMSRQVMADGIWQQHRMQIQGYIDENKRNVLSDLAVGDMSIIAAHSDQTYDTITVRVLAACADYDVDDKSGKVVRGDKRVEQWQEDWTFQRSSDATTKPNGGTLSSKCPNCGAPLDVDIQGVCKYCRAPVMSGKYDWVLARISQVGV
jgi:inner membrane protein import complex subunit Tim44-like protein